jgi:hypothetical protein
MQLADYFDDVVLIDTSTHPPGALRERLQRHGLQPWSLSPQVDDEHAGSARATLASALAHARICGARGALLVLADPGDDAAFWSSQDAVVEHLDSWPWDIVYLGHGQPTPADEDERPTLVHCDMPPRQVTAIAVSCAVLEALVEAMPDQGVDGPLTPSDWLAIACWLALDRVQPGRAWAAWPPLLRPRDGAPLIH